ncbi:hypothetical protein V6O07_02430, partial [Arthrospira platensis SPKY2]
MTDPNLTPAMRRALEVQQSALQSAVRTGENIGAAVQAARDLNSRVSAAVAQAAGTVASVFSPQTGAAFFESAERLRSGLPTPSATPDPDPETPAQPVEFDPTRGGLPTFGLTGELPVAQAFAESPRQAQGSAPYVAAPEKV